MLEKERMESKKQQEWAQRRSAVYDTKLRDLDYQFGHQLKSNLENEIIELRKQSSQQLDRIKQLEDNENNLQSKFPFIEKEKFSLTREHEHLKTKILELDALREDLLEKLNIYQQEVNNRDQEIRNLRDIEQQSKMGLNATHSRLNENEQLLQTNHNVIG